MIEKRLLKFNKMGNSGGKPKKKAKSEGLLAQSQQKLREASPPPSPPRGLASTLNSSHLTSEFENYLRELDTAETGETGDFGRALQLQYVLSVRNLLNAPESTRAELAFKIGEKFFFKQGEGLELENTQLWTRCKKVCEEGGWEAEEGRHRGLEYLRKAETACYRDLDEPHLLFMSQRADTSPVSQIISCLL